MRGDGYHGVLYLVVGDLLEMMFLPGSSRFDRVGFQWLWSVGSALSGGPGCVLH